jgi:hypothetical protein
MINKPATIPLKQILKIGNPLLSLVNIILLGLVLLFSYILKKIYNMIKSCGNKGYAKITLIIFNIFFSMYKIIYCEMVIWREIVNILNFKEPSQKDLVD